MEKLPHFTDYNIRNCKPVINDRQIVTGSAKHTLDSMDVRIVPGASCVEDSRFIVLMFAKEHGNFYNEISHRNLMFMVAFKSYVAVCSVERTIKKYNFKEFEESKP